MRNKTSAITLVIIALFVVTGCRYFEPEPESKSINHNQLLATFYTYYAAEYDALAHQAFNVAKERLTKIRQLNPAKENLAVVVDIDETVLDNSPYEARMILENKQYASDTWDEWCHEASAEAVPGALGFLRFADSLGFHIFYLSNRKVHLLQSTRQNLQALGFPQMYEDHFLLRDAERSKEGRRKSISEKYQIVLLAGDNIGDFYEDTLIFSEREKAITENEHLFGSKFIVLPNAMYGEWVKTLGISGNENTVDSLLRNMLIK